MDVKVKQRLIGARVPGRDGRVLAFGSFHVVAALLRRRSPSAP